MPHWTEGPTAANTLQQALELEEEALRRLRQQSGILDRSEIREKGVLTPRPNDPGFQRIDQPFEFGDVGAPGIEERRIAEGRRLQDIEAREADPNNRLDLRIARAVEAFGAGITGRTPLFMQEREQRQAQQRQQLDTLKLMRQFAMDDFNRVMGGLNRFDGNPRAQEEFLQRMEAGGSQQAKYFKRLPKKLWSEAAALMPDIQRDFPEFANKYQQAAVRGTLNDDIDPIETQTIIELVKEQRKERVKVRAKANSVAQARKRVDDGNALPGDAELVEEFDAEQTKRKEQAAAAKVEREITERTKEDVVEQEQAETAQARVDRLASEAIVNEVNQIDRQLGSLAATQGAAALDTPAGQQLIARRRQLLGLTGDSPQIGTKRAQGIANSLFGVSSLNEIPAAPIDAEMVARIKRDFGVDVPLGMDARSVPERILTEIELEQARLRADQKRDIPLLDKRTSFVSADALQNDFALVFPNDPNLTTREVTQQGFVPITAKQKQAYGDVRRGRTVAANTFDRARDLITATSFGERIVQAGRILSMQAQGDPRSFPFTAGPKEALSQIFARAFGEVGVLTQQDIQRWVSMLPGRADTKALLQAKEQLFNEMFNASQQAFVEQVTGVPSFATQRRINQLSERMDTISSQSAADAAKAQSQAEKQLESGLADKLGVR